MAISIPPQISKQGSTAYYLSPAGARRRLPPPPPPLPIAMMYMARAWLGYWGANDGTPGSPFATTVNPAFQLQQDGTCLMYRGLNWNDVLPFPTTPNPPDETAASYPPPPLSNITGEEYITGPQNYPQGGRNLWAWCGQFIRGNPDSSFNGNLFSINDSGLGPDNGSGPPQGAPQPNVPYNTRQAQPNDPTDIWRDMTNVFAFLRLGQTNVNGGPWDGSKDPLAAPDQGGIADGTIAAFNFNDVPWFGGGGVQFPMNAFACPYPPPNNFNPDVDALDFTTDPNFISQFDGGLGNNAGPVQRGLVPQSGTIISGQGAFALLEVFQSRVLIGTPYAIQTQMLFRDGTSLIVNTAQYPAPPPDLNVGDGTRGYVWIPVPPVIDSCFNPAVAPNTPAIQPPRQGQPFPRPDQLVTAADGQTSVDIFRLAGSKFPQVQGFVNFLAQLA